MRETLTAQFSHRVTMDDLVATYRLFLRRPPEPEGYAHHEKEVKLGMWLERLVSIFLEADESKRLCRPEITAVDLGGYSGCVDEKGTDFAPGILFNHGYEPHVRVAIRERFLPGRTFVDMGDLMFPPRSDEPRDREIAGWDTGSKGTANSPAGLQTIAMQTLCAWHPE